MKFKDQVNNVLKDVLNDDGNPDYYSDVHLALNAADKLLCSHSEIKSFALTKNKEQWAFAIDPEWDNTFSEIIVMDDTPSKAICLAILKYKGYNLISKNIK